MAIILTATEFKTDFPEFNDLSDAEILRFISRAGIFISTENYIFEENVQKLGLEYLTAHLLSLDRNVKSGDNTTAGENVASASVGGVSVSVQQKIANTSFEQWIQSTPYGRLFWALLVSKSPLPVFITGNPNLYGLK